MSELTYLVGDVFERLAEIPDGSIDVVITSPPFLALRSYLPADHPDKAREIGSEASPAAFLDRLLELTAEWGRVLAPHGSLCVELGDTYSGSGNGPDAMKNGVGSHDLWLDPAVPKRAGPGWPLAKSLTGIPTLYPWSLAYGRNLLTGADSPAGQWRIRNIIVWARPNPPVGALGDKFRPATSYITVACRSPKRYFDLDAVREPHKRTEAWRDGQVTSYKSGDGTPYDRTRFNVDNPAGAPPLDWHTDLEDGDWLWKLPTQPYKGAHYATFPLELPTRLIMAMCPLRVCQTCGKPSERIVRVDGYTDSNGVLHPNAEKWSSGVANGQGAHSNKPNARTITITTTGFTDCGHNRWRTGRVLDPFAGSGTTLQAAQNVGRHATGIDLDPRNADLARDHVGMFMTVNEGAPT